MYGVTVRKHVMIAHSLPAEAFGPARNLHGATYVVDARFRRSDLDENSVVIDIGLATEVLTDVLGELDYRNLDESPEFEGVLTTTEFLARHIHDGIRERLGADFRGGLEVVLHESHVASASYEGPFD